MKIRPTFVSNSSSSSFTINLIEVKDGFVKGYTWMDNFDMEYFLREIGIPDEKIEWGDYP